MARMQRVTDHTDNTDQERKLLIYPDDTDNTDQERKLLIYPG